MKESGRIISWFSCGAASAVASKIAVERWGRSRCVEIVNVDLSSDEHPDNLRFLYDVEKWLGVSIRKIKSSKYADTNDVFITERFIASTNGAACTKRLKREVQRRFQLPDDNLIVGFTYDEQIRIANLTERWPQENFVFLLSEEKITKADCFGILSSAGIKLPAMYALGYEHNNCLGCVKGGMGYWNKIRKDFPDVFKRRAEMERIVGFPILRDVWLDELDPMAGRDVTEPDIECGIFCSGYPDVLRAAIQGV